METESYVRDITSLRITDAEDAGGKGANLGELVAAQLPVPGGCNPDAAAAERRLLQESARRHSTV